MNKFIEEAQKLAITNEKLDEIYRNLLRGLEIILSADNNKLDIFGNPRNHFKVNWQVINDIVKEACDEKYCWEYGLGAIRYTSKYYDYLPDWRLMVNKMHDRIKKTEKDHEKIMRGLLDD